MYKFLFFFILVILYSSCFLFRDYRKREFVYAINGQNNVLPLIVPKGYIKQEVNDTAGVKMQTFRYGNGAIIYAAHLKDTLIELQPFNKSIHQPLIHRLGGLVFKGQDENGLFYREIRRGNFRFGYRFVPSEVEGLFDSATNYASLQRH